MMNAQEKIKNDEINFQADALTDLSVTDEQADETKGGASGTGKTLAAEVIVGELQINQ